MYRRRGEKENENRKQKRERRHHRWIEESVVVVFLLHGVQFLLGCFHCCLVRVSGVRRLDAADTFYFGTVIFEPETDVFRFELGKFRSVLAFVQLRTDAFDENVVGMRLDGEPLLELGHFGRGIDEDAVATRPVVVERRGRVGARLARVEMVQGDLGGRRLFADRADVVVIVALVRGDGGGDGRRLLSLLIGERYVEGLEVVEVVVAVRLLLLLFLLVRIDLVLFVVVVDFVRGVEFTLDQRLMLLVVNADWTGRGGRRERDRMSTGTVRVDEATFLAFQRGTSIFEPILNIVRLERFLAWKRENE